MESHDEVGLKKGPWTPEEDRKLLDYIQQHGRAHGSWRALPSKAGLRRCGKSCRLRWTNYLRPDIKRSKFTYHEDRTIIQLHALLGNKWSAIASHLSNRTDNEIKNYWHTHLKKRLAKMGIDPTTHKPMNMAFICNQAKDTAKLSHMAQWESARVEAEGRLIRKSNLIMSNTCSKAATATMQHWSTMPRAHQLPPCLDLIRVWAWANPGKDMISPSTVADTTLDEDQHQPPMENLVPVVGLPSSSSSYGHGVVNSIQNLETENPNRMISFGCCNNFNVMGSNSSTHIGHDQTVSSYDTVVATTAYDDFLRSFMDDVPTRSIDAAGSMNDGFSSMNIYECGDGLHSSMF